MPNTTAPWSSTSRTNSSRLDVQVNVAIRLPGRANDSAAGAASGVRRPNGPICSIEFGNNRQLGECGPGGCLLSSRIEQHSPNSREVLFDGEINSCSRCCEPS